MASRSQQEKGGPEGLWSPEELNRIDSADELQISSLRPDGALRPYVTIWVVRVSDDLYIRSAYGAENPWFRRAKTARVGRIQAGGVTREVTFADIAPDALARVSDDIDAAYRAKYGRYGPAIVDTVLGDQTGAVTLRLIPRG